MRALHQMDYTCKAISANARNDLVCAAYMNRIADEVPNPDVFMFIDELAHNCHSSQHNMGWP
jgi:hypothetical protein